MTDETDQYDCLEDAIKEVARACGGNKCLATILWPAPDKSPDSAHRLFLACCDENRAQRFTPGHLMTIMRVGRKRGCHAAMNFFARECGYKVKRVKREDRRTVLVRTLTEATVLAEQTQRELGVLDNEPQTRLMRVVGE